jgi:hypothetical protein
MMHLKRLTDDGVKSFSIFLESLQTDTPNPVPSYLLDEDGKAKPVPGPVVIEAKRFKNRHELGCYLCGLLSSSVPADVVQDPGLWTWLALFYFEQLCKRSKSGRWIPGERAKWIPDRDYRKYYRHLVRGPYQVCRIYADSPALCKALLVNSLDTPGELYEQVAARQQLVTNRGLVAAMTKMYLDPSGEKLRKGVGGKGGGSSRRLSLDVLEQFDLTFDLYGMSAEHIVGLLPREFDRFRQPPDGNVVT